MGESKAIKAMIKPIPIAVRQLMSRDLVVARPEDPIEKADQIFMSYNIHHLPIVDKDGQLQGLVTKSDYARLSRLLSLFKPAYEQVRMSDIMTRKLATIGPDEEVTEAAKVFQSNILHALPVVDSGQLVGLITTHDLLGFLLEERKRLA